MKLATIIASIVLGTSSIAAADSSFSVSGSATVKLGSGAVVLRDHRAEPRPIVLPAPAPRPTWIQLATFTAGKQSIKPGKFGPVDSLLLQPHGWVYLESAHIVFGNGTTQLERFNRWVHSSYGGVAINLAGSNRNIKSFTLNTRAYRGAGSVTVFGRNVAEAPAYHPAPALQGYTRLGTIADGAQTVKLDMTPSQIALVSTGPARIDALVLKLANGTEHRMELDRQLTRGSSPLFIDLPRYRMPLASIRVISRGATSGVELVMFAR